MWRLIPLLLIGCTPVSPEFYKNRVNTEFVPMTSKELLKQCGRGARGCFEAVNGICYIYAKEPKWLVSTSITTIGHEYVHCVRGYYH